MDSCLITPPDIVSDSLHAITIIDPDQAEVDTVIKFCQHCEQAYNIYIYTPNMNDLDWLAKAVDISDVIIVNTKTDKFVDYWLLDKAYYYGSRILIENPRKILDPVQYFSQQLSTK